MLYPNVNGATVPPGIPSGTLFVSVRKTWQANNPVVPPNVSLEDCARGYWTVRCLTEAHADQCEYLMAQKKGVIVGAWKIDRTKGVNGWMEPMLTPKKTWPNDCLQHPIPSDRRGCELKANCELIADVNLNQFVGQRVRVGRHFNPLRGYFIP